MEQDPAKRDGTTTTHEAVDGDMQLRGRREEVLVAHLARDDLLGRSLEELVRAAGTAIEAQPVVRHCGGGFEAVEQRAHPRVGLYDAIELVRHLVPDHRHRVVAADGGAGTPKRLFGAIAHVHLEHIVPALGEAAEKPVAAVIAAAPKAVTHGHRGKLRLVQHAIHAEVERQAIIHALRELHSNVVHPVAVGEVHVVRLKEGGARRRVDERAARIPIDEQQQPAQPVEEDRAVVARRCRLIAHARRGLREHCGRNAHGGVERRGERRVGCEICVARRDEPLQRRGRGEVRLGVRGPVAEGLRLTNGL